MRAEYLHRKLILHGYNINNTFTVITLTVLFRSFKVKDSLNRSVSLYVTSVLVPVYMKVGDSKVGEVTRLSI